jgi:hypothetical protein
MLNPQLAQHLAFLQDDGNDDLSDTAATDRAPGSAQALHAAMLPQDEDPSEHVQHRVRVRFLPGLFGNRPGYSHDRSAFGGVTVVVASMVAVLSAVLPASPVWRGLVTGLAVVLMHYHSQNSRLWNDKDDSSKSNQNRLLRDKLQRQRQRQDSRVRLSTLLGLMGAPPLSGEAEVNETDTSATSVTTTTTTALLPRHFQQDWTFLQDFAQQNAGLVETVDQTMEMLKRATSMGLGLGWRASAAAASTAAAASSVSVERVELAAVGRVRRRNQSTVSVHTGFSLSLSRLRQTLYRFMARQKALLLTILDDLNECTSFVDDSGDEVFSRRDPTDPVVTLALLRRGRNDLVHILGMILDRCSSSKENNLVLSDSSIRSKQNLSMTLANEARAHLLASLTLSSHGQRERERERTPFQRRVSDLHAQVDALQVALIGCHDESVSESESEKGGGGGVVVTDETQAAKWWEHVSNLLDEVNSTRRTVEQEFFPSSLDEPAPEANLEHAFNEQRGARSTEEREEFKADGQPTHHPTEQSQDAQGQRTFIFSGSGAVAPRRKRVEKSTVASSEKARPAQYDSFFMEQSLIHELRSHLQAMPPTEEVDVVQMEVAECCDDNEGAQRVVETPAASLRGVSGVASGLLGELEASLKSLPKEDRSLQWEVAS